MTDCKHEVSKLRLSNIHERKTNHDRDVIINVTLICSCGEKIYFGDSYELTSTESIKV